ncbi:eCIS core domain-containing protein [Massilia timonae]|uniref:DNA/RNA non-specific endonuclease family protein n=1 Tax=Massilia timonae TaxID=47229 RepID=A0A1S2NEN8_9BURK|nr:DUF4157 domain-containing protein [Massilia timonae]OIJ43537.1 DNA/RNA non-specific endonuclease family protein [Massilia timonae]
MQASSQPRIDADTVGTEAAATPRQGQVLADNRAVAQAQSELPALWNNSPRVLQQRAVAVAIHESPRIVAQRREMDGLFDETSLFQEDDAMSAALPPARRERRANRTGLPDSLKSGIESLAGMSMDHVRVHYNSNKPAQLQALAYAQGSEIHLGPGQQHHLPHEAWHVVQQAQGRVRPTLQMKAGLVNDDPVLESEADTMGEEAVRFRGGQSATGGAPEETADGMASRHADAFRLSGGQPENPGTRNATEPVQRMVCTTDQLPTPSGVIKDHTGQPGNSQLLPGSQPMSAVRPRTVTATIDQNTIRDGDRAKDGVLSKVTAMARAEQRILQGADMQKFYDAGHLVGDQLIGKKIDSFVYGNLAPQVSTFNTPAYSGVESGIAAFAKQGFSYQVSVSVDYPPDYSVTVAHLKKRGIIAQSSKPDNHVLKIPRRIPDKWSLSAKFSQSNIGAPVHVPSGHLGATTSPTLGAPFSMDHGVIVDANQMLSHGTYASGLQWYPREDISAPDLVSLLSKNFEDLGSEAEIAQTILTKDHQVIRASANKLIRSAAGEIALALLDLTSTVSALTDTRDFRPFLETARPGIENYINLARQDATELGMAIHYLVMAKGWVDALKEKAEEIKQEQSPQFFFSPAKGDGSQQLQPPERYAADYEMAIEQATPEFQQANPDKADEIEAKNRQFVDMKGKYDRLIEGSSGGELHINATTFNQVPDVLPGQHLLVNGAIVLLHAVDKVQSMDGQTLGWILRYKYNLNWA